MTPTTYRFMTEGPRALRLCGWPSLFDDAPAMDTARSLEEVRALSILAMRISVLKDTRRHS